MKYLFVNGNQGYSNTYHPFTTDLFLTQKSVYDRLLKIPGAGRTGTRVEHLIEILLDEGHKADYWTCPCCGNIVREIKNPKLNDWTVLEGITGNY